MHILIIVFNNFINDTRVIRQAEELSNKGFKVSIAALHRYGLPYKDEQSFCTVYRIPLSVHNSVNYIHKIVNMDKIKISDEFLNQNIYPNQNLNQKINGGKSKLADIFIKKLHTFWRIKGSPSEILAVLINYKRIIRYKLIKSTKKKYKSNLINKIIGYIEFKARKKNYERLIEVANSVAREVKPDFVLANDFNGLLAAERIFDEQNINFAYDSHELWTERNRPLDHTSDRERKWELERENKAIHKSLFNFTVCKSIAEHMGKIYNIKEPYVVRNTPNSLQLTNDQHFDLKKKLSLSDNVFLCIYIGKITYNRGVEDVLNALPLLAPNIQFATMGHFDNNFKLVFKDLVKQNKISDRVHCVDAVPSHEVAQWASSADISITPGRQICLSYIFGLPNKVFESVQAHLPIITPNSPEFERITDEFGCGIKYTDENYHELAEKITLLATNKELRDQLTLGSINASKELIWEKERKVFLKPFDTLLPTQEI